MLLSIRRTNSFPRDSRGATAIEYAILAGLIGLGIVGSLVTTRGSLSATFGTASTQMDASTTAAAASASGGAPANPLYAARASFWSAKTVASKTFDPAVNGTPLQRLRVVFSDGTTAVTEYGGSATFPYQVSVTDPVAKTVTNAYFNQDRQLNYFQILQMDDAMAKPIRGDVAAMPGFAAFPGTPPVVQNHELYTYNSSGAMSSYSTTAVDPTWVSKAQTGPGDFAYFDALKPNP